MNLDNIFTNIIQDTWSAYEWFVYNSLKAHPENFQFIALRNTGLHTLQIRDITPESVSSVTLLGITINLKLNFKEDINNVIKKAYYKLYSLRKLQNFLTQEKAKILACPMIESQFA